MIVQCRRLATRRGLLIWFFFQMNWRNNYVSAKHLIVKSQNLSVCIQFFWEKIKSVPDVIVNLFLSNYAKVGCFWVWNSDWNSWSIPLMSASLTKFRTKKLQSTIIKRRQQKSARISVRIPPSKSRFHASAIDHNFIMGMKNKIVLINKVIENYNNFL